MTNQDITHLTQAIMDLKGQIERMSERQDEMLEDVKKIKEAVYNPDSGLYARLRALEQWKDSQSMGYSDYNDRFSHSHSI